MHCILIYRHFARKRIATLIYLLPVIDNNNLYSECFVMSEGIAVYSRRWLILACACTVTLLTLFAAKSFTISNHIYAAYFDVKVGVIDWSVLGINIGTASITPLFTWLFFRQSIGFRKLLIVGTFCVLLSYLIIILAIHFPTLYPLMNVSNLFLGVAYISSFTIGPSFAVTWFPDHQVGVVIACDLLSQNLGILVGIITPSLVLKNPFVSNTTGLIEEQMQHLRVWRNETHKNLLLIYAPGACTLFLLLIFYIVYATDLPPKPPTQAMLVKRRMTTSLPKPTFSKYVDLLKLLFQDITFVLCTLICSLGITIIIILQLCINSIIPKLNIDNLGIHWASNVMGGALICIFFLTNMLFGFVAAKLTAKWKRYAAQIRLGLGLTFMTLLTLSLMFYYSKFVGFSICLFLYAVSSRIFILPLYEIVTRHTYPIDETMVSIWVGAISSVTCVIIGKTARVVLTYTAPVGLFVMMCMIMFATFILALFIRPIDKRAIIDRQKKDEDVQDLSEETALLSQN